MSTHNTDNPSPTLTENLTENRSLEITGNPTLSENTIPASLSLEKTVEEKKEKAFAENSCLTEVAANSSTVYQTNRSSKRPAGRKSFLKVTREQLMAAIGECAATLGHVPSHAELMRSGKVSGRQIVKKFPSKADYEHLGKHSDTPLKSRFGSWSQVPRYLRRYMEEQGLTEEWKDVMALIREYEQGQDGLEMPATPECEQKKPRVMTDRPVYGPLIRPYPMIHGPINENGVLYLFGTVSERLGFVVTLIQGAFPDCYAMRLVDVDRWQPVRIEFEYESRNFLKHMHDPSGCDIIVCWKHNWPECPLEVIELSGVVGEGSYR